MCEAGARARVERAPGGRGGGLLELWLGGVARVAELSDGRVLGELVAARLGSARALNGAEVTSLVEVRELCHERVARLGAGRETCLELFLRAL